MREKYKYKRDLQPIDHVKIVPPRISCTINALYVFDKHTYRKHIGNPIE